MSIMVATHRVRFTGGSKVFPSEEQAHRFAANRKRNKNDSRVEVVPLDGPVYVVKYREDGRQKTKQFQRKRRALHFEAKKRTEQANTRAGIPKPRRVELDELKEEYFRYLDEDCRNVDHRQTARRLVEEFIKSIGVRYAHEVTAELFVRFRNQLHKGKRNKNYYYSVVRSMFQRGIEAGFVQVNPLAGVKKLREDNPFRPWLGKALLERVMKAVRDKNPRIYPAIAAIIQLGLRASEVCHVEWSDVVGSKLHVRAKPRLGWQPKWGTERHLQIPPDMGIILNAQPRTSNFIFPNTNRGKMDPDNLRHQFQKAVKDVEGLEEFGPDLHLLRHSYCCLLVLAGFPITDVQLLMGHKEIGQTLNYFKHVAIEKRVEERVMNTRLLDMPPPPDLKEAS